MKNEKLNFTTEHHPWNYFIPDGATTLIIGTFPPTTKNWSFDFFYPNKRNLFWKILAEINGEELLVTADEVQAILQRKSILAALKIGITDMGKSIYRYDNSSLDEKLGLIEPMDIFLLLKLHPSIKQIILTSSSGPASALSWFIDYVNNKGVKITSPKGKKPLAFTLAFEKEKIDVHVLYSPSPRAANRISFLALKNMYLKVIMGI